MVTKSRLLESQPHCDKSQRINQTCTRWDTWTGLHDYLKHSLGVQRLFPHIHCNLPIDGCIDPHLCVCICTSHQAYNFGFQKMKMVKEEVKLAMKSIWHKMERGIAVTCKCTPSLHCGPCRSRRNTHTAALTLGTLIDDFHTNKPLATCSPTYPTTTCIFSHSLNYSF